MRINKYVALATGLGRRPADAAVAGGRVLVNGQPATIAQDVLETDNVMLDGNRLSLGQNHIIMLNKPAGFVVSRDGQGNRTIYDLLPAECQSLKPVGRLDKESSGLLLLTNDGQLAHQLTHPGYQKSKTYEVALDLPLQPLHRQMISDHGVTLEDGPSKLELERVADGDDKRWRVTMHEGRNRQIRRTFAALGYTVTKLHRTHFGSYALAGLPVGQYQSIS